MRYVLVASPAFLERYPFSDPLAFIKKAPVLKFDHNDYMHERSIKDYFPQFEGPIPFQIIPSVAGFKKYALMG